MFLNCSNSLWWMWLSGTFRLCHHKIWDSASQIEIMKQCIPQNNFSNKWPCYNIEFINSFWFWLSLITHGTGIFLIRSYAHSFYCLTSTLMFFLYFSVWALEHGDIISDVNIRADFVGWFSACYSGRPRGWFSDLRFGVTLTFKLIAGF